MKNDDEYRRVRVRALETMSRAICAAYGPKPGCLCDGARRRCHAVILYNDFSIAALLGLERAGFAVLEMPAFDMEGAMAEAVAALEIAATVTEGMDDESQTNT